MKAIDGVYYPPQPAIKPIKCTRETPHSQKQDSPCCSGKPDMSPYLREIDMAVFRSKIAHPSPPITIAPGPERGDDPNIVDNFEDLYGQKPDYSLGDAVAIFEVDEGRSAIGYTADGKPYFLPEEQWKSHSYHSYEEKNGNRYFFRASTDFLLDAAKHYAKIEDSQELKYRPTHDEDFILSLTNFFYGENVTQDQIKLLKTEIDTAVRELAKQIKNGEGADISKLKSTITIAGENVTFKEIKQIQLKSQQFEEMRGGSSCGSGSVEKWGIKGLAKGVALAFGDTLGGKLGESYKQAIAKAADEDFAASCRLAEAEGAAIADKFGVQSYELFSNVRTNADFKSAMETFDRLLNKYNEAWNGSVGSNQLAAMRKDMVDAYINLI